MAHMSVVVAVVVLCTSLAAVSAQKNYAAQYPLGGGVDKYKKFADEICQIADLASGGKFDDVRKLYVKNKKDAGYADSLQAFASKGSDFSGQRYYQLAATYNPEGPGWLDDFFMSALDKTKDFQNTDAARQKQGIIKTAQSGMGIQLMLKEIDSANTDLVSGKKDGAVKALDESFAVFASRPTCGPYALGDKYANQFGTINDCTYNTSLSNKKIVNGYINARAAAQKGDKDAFETNTNAIVQGILEVHIQAVLNYAKKMSASTDPTKALELQMEGYVFYRTIAPFIAQANKDSDKLVLKYIEDDKPAVASYGAIKTALEATYAKLGVDIQNIGAWKDSPSVTCPAKSSAASLAAKALAMFGGLLAAVAAAFL